MLRCTSRYCTARPRCGVAIINTDECSHMQTTAPIASSVIIRMKHKNHSPLSLLSDRFPPQNPSLLSQSYLFFGLEHAAFLTDCSFVDNVLVPPDPNQETVGRRSKFSSCRRKVKAGERNTLRTKLEIVRTIMWFVYTNSIHIASFMLWNTPYPTMTCKQMQASQMWFAS